MSLTRTKLDSMGCGTPDCGHDHSVLYFHARCHMQEPVEVCYEKATGEIVVACKRCQQEVVRIAVAP